ncbi:hypothetical protein Lal_00041763, partial [Lupinus albus]
PSNTSLLRLQQSHVSIYVWDGEEITFRARCNFWQSLPHEQVLQLIRNTAFGPILEIGSVEVNNHLLTVKVERWRLETHTFHFPNGECTITLEDVAYQLGLPIDGKAITGDTTMDWEDLCLQLLGELPEDAYEELVEQHARAFILRMIGGFIMPNTSGSRVHLMYIPLLDELSEKFDYNWGSAILAWLCRATVFKDKKEVGGCLLLLQSLTYDHIPILAPRLHDYTLQYFPLVKRWSKHLITTNIPGHAANIILGMLDRLRVDQFVWTPYTSKKIMGQIPNICRAHVPLICFATVEWHVANRSWKPRLSERGVAWARVAHL